MKASSLSKNAYLSLYVSHSFLCANLAYVDKSKTYFLKDKSFLLSNLDDLSHSELVEYWLDYFKSLEEKWNWDIIQTPKVSQNSLMVNFTNFKAEKTGVSGCKVLVSKNNVDYKRIFESLRKFSLDIKIVGIDSDSDRDLLEKFATAIDYDDVLLLDLHSRFFKIARVEKKEVQPKKDLSKIHLPDYEYSDVKVRWGSSIELLELLNGSKYKSFLSKHISSNILPNIWGNFLQKPIFKGDSELLQDFIRAYITIQLLSLCSDNPKIANDFGLKPTRNLLWLTGDLINIPSFKELLIATIDGLQLRGDFDFVLDTDSLIYTFGKTFCAGEKSDEIFFNKETFLPSFTKIFAPDIDLRPDNRKVIFHGSLFSREDESREVFAMSSEITQINIRKPEKMYLEGRFVKNAYIEKRKKHFDFHCFKDGIKWDKIIFDSRIKPVVYGPDIKTNNIKFNLWLSGEHYS